MRSTPRAYQLDLVERSAAAIGKGYRRIAVQGETGCGKTLFIALVAERALAKDKRVLILAHMRSLIWQMKGGLEKEGISCGIIMAEALSDRYQPVQVGSKDTLISWMRKERDLPPADIVIVDEGDRAMAHYYNLLVSKYKCPILLVTATPCDEKGFGMGNYADALICGPKPSSLIEQGVIVPTKVFAPLGPNLKGIKFTADGLPERQVMSRIMKPQVVGDIVDHWQRIAEGRPTICFCQDVDHSLFIRDRFLDAGIPAKHIDADTPEGREEDCHDEYHQTQKQYFSELERGEIKIITNVGMINVGKDLPFVSCCILAAVDRSIRRFRQRIGRIKRQFGGNEWGLPAKEYGLVLDHSGSSRFLGLPDEDIEWVLDAGKRPLYGKYLPKEKQPIHCGNPECQLVYRGSVACPSCGWMPEDRGRKGKDKKNAKPGMLFELFPDAETADTDRLEAIKREHLLRVWHKCLAIVAHKGGKFRQAGAMYHNEAGHYVPDDFPNVPRGNGWDQLVQDVCPGYLRGGSKK